VLDTPAEPALDELAALAAHACEAPIALISLVDERRQWSKASVGLPAGETPRDLSFCAHAILQPDLFIVPDAATDERFAGNPLVTGDPQVRFYAGAPLVSADHHALGTLCVMDRVARTLRPWQREALRMLGRQVMAQLEQRRQARDLARSERLLRTIFDSEPECVKVLDQNGALRMMNRAGLALIEADSFGQVAGQCISSLVVPEHRAAFEALMARVFRGESGSVEFQIVGLKGAVRWLETHAAPLRDERGDVSSLLGITRDITAHKRVVAALRDKTVELETALTIARMGAWSWDFSSDAVTTLQGGGPVSGLPEASYPTTGAAFMALVHPDDRALVGERIERAKASGPYEAEFRIVLPDGSIRWVAARGECVRNADGAATGLSGIDQDITERKEAEQQIQYLNRVYALLSDINQIIVRTQDAPAMLMAACRSAVEQGRFRMAWIGLVDEATGQLEVVAHAGATPDTLDILNGILGSDRRGGGCAFTTHVLHTGLHAVCNEIASDPGAASWCDAALERGYRSMASLPLMAAGRVLGAFNLYAGEPGFFDADELRLLDELAMDVSFALEVRDRDAARRRTEQSLLDSDERFHQLADNIHEVFWMTDPATHQVLYVSPAYESIWGRPCETVYESPRRWLDAVHPDDRARVIEAADTRQGSGEYDETYRIQRPDGTVRWIRDRAFPVRDEAGTLRRIVGTAEDVTERRQLQEQFLQSQKMEAIGQLAGGVAHDFNNILTVIQGYGSLLLMDAPDPAETTEAAEEIVHAAERAAHLTRQLLAFSRRQVMQVQRVDLNEIVAGLARMLQRIVGEDVRMDILLHPRPVVVRADAGMLDQVVMNLVVNARDAMPGGGQLVIATTEQDVTEADARAHAHAAPGPHACLRVADTGEGIAPENVPHIFEPFFTTKEAGKGTGLGLATVYGIVTQHGGWIEVDSEAGRGTAVRMFLPLAGAVADSPAEGAATAPPRGGTETILLVEDEASVRRVRRLVLERAGYQVLEAANGVEASRVWEQHEGRVDLLVTDMVMPEGVGGRELAARLRARDPGLRVIFTTGYSADMAGRDQSRPEGEYFVRKPSSPEHLLDTVRRCLDA
jgi:PAS domain S-box-containing protein